jgi:hypothetical protein
MNAVGVASASRGCSPVTWIGVALKKTPKPDDREAKRRRKLIGEGCPVTHIPGEEGMRVARQTASHGSQSPCSKVSIASRACEHGIIPNRPGIESQLRADRMGMCAGSVWTTCTSAHVRPGYRSTRGYRRKCFLLLMIDDFPKKRNAVYLLFLCRLSGVCRANIPIGINSSS